MLLPVLVQLLLAASAVHSASTVLVSGAGYGDVAEVVVRTAFAILPAVAVPVAAVRTTVACPRRLSACLSP